MLLRQIFDPYLAQYAYLIGCQRTGEALIIDPQRDIDRYKNAASENGLRITAATETHIHADFVSGLQEFAANPDIHIYLSAEGGAEWSYRWPANRTKTHLLKHGDQFKVGNIRLEVLHTPGHTPEHICFLITDLGAGAHEPMALISGDFLFAGDVGRPDLLESAAGMKDVMEPSARVLRSSLSERLAGLDDYLQILPGHGAGSACGKSLGAVPFSTLGYERRFNAALKLALSDAAAFVKDVLLGQPDPPLYFATMKKVNRDGIPVRGVVPTAPRLSAKEYTELASDKTIRILDTRDDKLAFDTSHTARAINAPLRTPFFTAAVGSFLDPDDRILLVIESEEDLDIAQRQLFRIGFDHLIGWITYEDAQYGGIANTAISRIDFPKFNPFEALKDGAIIDVRTSAEFERGHLQDAKSYPYTRIKSHIGSLPKDRTLYVHCASGRRATLATSFLCSEGFNAVHVDGMFFVPAK